MHKVKEAGHEKIFVGIRANFFLNLMSIINSRSIICMLQYMVVNTDASDSAINNHQPTYTLM